MWKNILAQLNAIILKNWQLLLTLIVGFVLGAANCGGLSDVVVQVLPGGAEEAVSE